MSFLQNILIMIFFNSYTSSESRIIHIYNHLWTRYSFKMNEKLIIDICIKDDKKHLFTLIWSMHDQMRFLEKYTLPMTTNVIRFLN